MSSISHKSIVYYDETLKQNVVNSYDMYKLFQLPTHKQMVRSIKTALSIQLEIEKENVINCERWTYMTTSINIEQDIISTKVLSGTGAYVQGFLLTEMGFHKTLMIMRTPKLKKTQILVTKATNELLQAFHNMKNLITNHLMKLPKDPKERKETFTKFKNGEMGFNRGYFFNLPNGKRKNKPNKEMGEVLLQVNDIIDSFSDPYAGE